MATKIKETKRLTDWQVLEIMVEKNKDIRAFRHILGIELKGKKNSQFSELKIQIDPETHQEIAEMMMYGGYGPSKKIVVCYVIDRAQFDEIKNSDAPPKPSVLDAGLPNRFKK